MPNLEAIDMYNALKKCIEEAARVNVATKLELKVGELDESKNPEAPRQSDYALAIVEPTHDSPPICSRSSVDFK